MAGQAPTDTRDAGPGDTDCLGATRYATDEPVPDGALRASLGCGNPQAIADIAPGETVLDLGSGGGLDVILSVRRTGPTGKVYGLDAGPDMLTLARTNAEQAGVDNTEFLHGHIENISVAARCDRRSADRRLGAGRLARSAVAGAHAVRVRDCRSRPIPPLAEGCPGRPLREGRAELPERLDEVPTDKPLAVTCGSGYRSSVAASLLAAQRPLPLFNMIGGMTAWKVAGYPTETTQRTIKES